MNSMSDVVALKQVDMETIQRERRTLVPITPRLVSWDVNNQRSSSYFPNINRSYIADLTYVPGHFINKRAHSNSVNRAASWSPYSSVKIPAIVEAPEISEELAEELENQGPTEADAMYHPTLQVNKPLGLLKREYKHPLSMYEEALNNMYSKYASEMYKMPSIEGLKQDPTLPRQYYTFGPHGIYYYVDRPQIAGKEWVTNRWRMWSGGSATSPE